MLAGRDLRLAGRLDGASVELEPGGIVAICGPNGAGKSSLLEALAGLLAVSGEVTLDGAALDTIAGRERAKAIGYLPQNGEIAWDMTVRSLVGLGRLPHGDAASEPVERSLASCKVGELGDRRISTLSGGERSRALLARVLAGEPRWILADEPLAALDLAHQLAQLATLRSAAMAGAGVVLVLHDLALAMNHADRVVVMSAGRVVADGHPTNALGAATIATVWRVDAQWTGAEGSRALSIAVRS